MITGMSSQLSTFLTGTFSFVFFNQNGQPIGLRLSELRAEVDVSSMSLKPRKLLIAAEELCTES
jgi:hypothetical protein